MKITDGKITIKELEFNMFMHKGYEVNRNTSSYTNHIGVEAHRIGIGFGGWNDNLSVYLDIEEGIQILDIKTEDDLNNVLNFMDSLLKIKDLKTKK